MAKTEAKALQRPAGAGVGWAFDLRGLTGFFPRIRRIFPSGFFRSNPGKFRSFGPYHITIGRVTRFEEVSVTDYNLKSAAVQLGCKLATHCSVFVQLVTGEIASVQSS